MGIVSSAASFAGFALSPSLQAAALRFQQAVVRVGHASGCLGDFADAIFAPLLHILQSPFQTPVLPLAVDLLCESGWPLNADVALLALRLLENSQARRATAQKANADVVEDHFELALARLAHAAPGLRDALLPAAPPAMRALLLTSDAPELPELICALLRSSQMHEIAAGFFAFAGALRQLPDGVARFVAAVASAVIAQFAGDGDPVTELAVDGAAVALAALILSGQPLEAADLEAWLQALPVRVDAPEAAVVCEALLVVLEAGEANGLRPFLEVAADIGEKERINGAVRERFRAALGAVLACDGVAVAWAMEQLSTAQAAAVRAFARGAVH
jgi:hypothetical protein